MNLLSLTFLITEMVEEQFLLQFIGILRRIFELVRFVIIPVPPMLLIPHQLVGAPEGFNVTIECFTEAHPTSLNYWTRGEGPIIHDSHKYK